jgi:hypothetical protein
LLVISERPDLHVGEAERRPGGLDVAGNEGGFPNRLRRLDAEALNEGGIGGADHHRHEHPEPHRSPGQQPPPEAGVDDEQHRGQHGNGDQQIERGQVGVDVGVGGSVDDSPGRGGDLETVEVVAARPEQRHGAQQDGHVAPDGGGNDAAGGLQAEAAVAVVTGEGHEGHHDEGAEEPVDHEGDERQLEDVEADIAAELGIGNTEVHPVSEQDPVPPVTAHASTDELRGQDGGEQAGEGRPAVEEGVDGLERVLFRSGRAEAGSQTVGDEQVEPHEPERQADEEHKQADLGAQQAFPNAGEPD